MSVIRVIKGGPGSGHYGHRGRPGEVGGSLPRGGMGSQYPAMSAPDVLVGNVVRLDAYQSESHGMTTYVPEDRRAHVYIDDGGVMKVANWGDPDDYAFENIGNGARSEIKDKIATGIAQQLVDEGYYEDFDTAYEEANNMLGTWADTSNDSSLRSLSLQKAASEEFGVQLSEWQTENYETERAHYQEAMRRSKILANRRFEMLKRQRDEGLAGTRHVSHFLLEASDEELRKEAWRLERPYLDDDKMPAATRDRERAFLRIMYNQTQADLRKHGFDENDTITVFRGKHTSREYEGKIVGYKGSTLESWSSSIYVGHGFGNYVLAAKIPVKNIIGTCKTGFGCVNEAEFVTLGSLPGQYVYVLSSTLEPEE